MQNDPYMNMQVIDIMSNDDTHEVIVENDIFRYKVPVVVKQRRKVVPAEDAKEAALILVKRSFIAYRRAYHVRASLRTSDHDMLRSSRREEIIQVMEMAKEISILPRVSVEIPDRRPNAEGPYPCMIGAAEISNGDQTVCFDAVISFWKIILSLVPRLKKNIDENEWVEKIITAMVDPRVPEMQNALDEIYRIRRKHIFSPDSGMLIGVSSDWASKLEEDFNAMVHPCFINKLPNLEDIGSYIAVAQPKPVVISAMPTGEKGYSYPTTILGIVGPKVKDQISLISDADKRDEFGKRMNTIIDDVASNEHQARQEKVIQEVSLSLDALEDQVKTHTAQRGNFFGFGRRG